VIILDRFPKYDEMNQVYLKMGRAYEALGKHAEAHGAYLILMERYPKVPETAEASERVSDLERQHPNLASDRLPAKAATPTPPPEGTATQATLPTQTPVVSAPPPAAPFRVQVGVYSVKKYAELAVSRLIKAGYKPVIVTAKVPGTGALVYKVREGGYASRIDAHEGALGISRKLHMTAIVVEEP
jgi:cell division protein FtsN